MRAIALYVIALWGWRRAVAALLAGAVLSLALPPFDLWPVIVLAFPVLVWLLDGVGDVATTRRSRAFQAFLIGWLFGFGYLMTSLYWIGHAFLVDAEIYAWMLPLAITLLPAGMALFIGAAAMVAQACWSPGPARIFALAAAWGGFEWLRGHLFTGFPWNAVGYTLSANEALPQAASIFGIYGLGMLAVLIGALPALAACDGGGRSGMVRYGGPLAAFLLVAGLWSFGAARLAASGAGTVEGVRLRIVQPNIAQADKWKRENRSRIFSRILELSNSATSPTSSGIADVTHLIWPESAVPFLLGENEGALAAIAALLPETTTLLTGALRAEQDDAPGTSTSRRPIRNSVLEIDSGGSVVSTYDKFQLVPFGEYLPAAEWLSQLGIRQLAAIPVGFESGGGPVTLAVANAPPVSPLICYEIIFPGAVVDRKARPGWILNVTNDAWFGESAGPLQHLRQARMRAIEEGLPVVRAANTGISAVIDANGRLLRRLASGVAGVIDARLPAALSPTLYARYGDLLFLAMLLIAGAVGVFGRRGPSAHRSGLGSRAG